MFSVIPFEVLFIIWVGGPSHYEERRCEKFCMRQRMVQVWNYRALRKFSKFFINVRRRITEMFGLEALPQRERNKITTKEGKDKQWHWVANSYLIVPHWSGASPLLSQALLYLLLKILRLSKICLHLLALCSKGSYFLKQRLTLDVPMYPLECPVQPINPDSRAGHIAHCLSRPSEIVKILCLPVV